MPSVSFPMGPESGDACHDGGHEEVRMLSVRPFIPVLIVLAGAGLACGGGSSAPSAQAPTSIAAPTFAPKSPRSRTMPASALAYTTQRRMWNPRLWRDLAARRRRSRRRGSLPEEQWTPKGRPANSRHSMTSGMPSTTTMSTRDSTAGTGRPSGTDTKRSSKGAFRRSLLPAPSGDAQRARGRAFLLSERSRSGGRRTSRCRSGGFCRDRGVFPPDIRRDGGGHDRFSRQSRRGSRLATA